METRQLGRTGHDSTVMTFGAIALNWLEQEGANQMVEHVLDYGVNHVDVAPMYGDAELKLAPKLNQHREDIFLGCKTQERDYDGAWDRLEASLERLDVETIDLHQVHGLEYEHELETITSDDGALTAFREAKDRGLIEHIGLTSHADPRLLMEAIDRIPNLESVMFPLNPVVMAKDGPEYDYAGVLEKATEKNIGTLAIKAFADGSWPPTDELPEDDRPFSNWYRPTSTPAEIQERFEFVASQGVTSVINPGDPKLVTMTLEAAAGYEVMDEPTQRSVIEKARHEDSPVPQQLHH